MNATLTTAVREGLSVTVATTDGRRLTGVPVEAEDGRYKMMTGRRGRPATFAPGDVEEVTFA